MLGSMGLTIPIALGVAIAQPQRHVIALEGDGSLLMQLGCLATVAERAPKNLTIVVWDNGIYQITGSQPTASAAIGRPRRHRARRRHCATAPGPPTKTISTGWSRPRSRAEAPSLIAARIDNKPAVGATDRDPVQIRERFMRGLGVKRGTG